LSFTPLFGGLKKYIVFVPDLQRVAPTANGVARSFMGVACVWWPARHTAQGPLSTQTAPPLHPDCIGRCPTYRFGWRVSCMVLVWRHISVHGCVCIRCILPTVTCCMFHCLCGLSLLLPHFFGWMGRDWFFLLEASFVDVKFCVLHFGIGLTS
jgi:hypothetical protein